MRKNLGFILLALWLIGTGLISLFHLNFIYRDLVMSALAVAAGVLILVRK
ncbi:MAG TPA: hypothetical protein VHO28_02875 [Ignavibacteriales bacterium]|nr:hypothetical protein [Ignavibacteriales bacterium]HEX3075173.1 hypothetical protein [Ignavibacteriales bacterium]